MIPNCGIKTTMVYGFYACVMYKEGLHSPDSNAWRIVLGEKVSRTGVSGRRKLQRWDE